MSKSKKQFDPATTKVPNSTPVDLAGLDKCEKCGYNKVESAPYIQHDEICAYFVFKDQEASARGLQSVLNGRITLGTVKNEVIPALKDAEVEHVVYQFTGFIPAYDVFVQEAVCNAIHLWYGREGFAGMTLAEFIRKMV